MGLWESYINYQTFLAVKNRSKGKTVNYDAAKFPFTFPCKKNGTDLGRIIFKKSTSAAFKILNFIFLYQHSNLSNKSSTISVSNGYIFQA